MVLSSLPLVTEVGGVGPADVGGVVEPARRDTPRHLVLIMLQDVLQLGGIDGDVGGYLAEPALALLHRQPFAQVPLAHHARRIARLGQHPGDVGPVGLQGDRVVHRQVHLARRIPLEVLGMRAPPGVAARQTHIPARGAQGGGGEGPVEPHPLGEELIDMRRVNLPAQGPEGARPLIVGDDKQNIRPPRRAILPRGKPPRQRPNPRRRPHGPRAPKKLAPRHPSANPSHHRLLIYLSAHTTRPTAR